jgi:hypothetical protein
MQRLRHDKRGISNVVTAMLGLIIVVIIVTSVFIPNYEMNAVDREREQELISIENVVRGDTVSHTLTGYSLLESTRPVSGSTSNLAYYDSVYMTARSYASATSTTSKTDAFIAYRSSSGVDQLSSPKNRNWNGDTVVWGAESEMPSGDNSVLFTRVVYCPVQQRSFEKTVVTLTEEGFLNAYVYDGTSWTMTSDIGQVWMSLPTQATRPYDVAYETVSGDVLLVYETVVGGGTKDLAYRTWSLKTGWSQERYYDDADHASKIAVTFVELTSVPNSDKIGVVYLDGSNSHANAMVWDGSAFTNVIELTAAISITTEECISVASETGGAIVAVAGEGEFIKWSRFTSSWSPVAVFDINSGATNAMNWLKLAQAQDDRLMLTSVDGATDLATSVLDESSIGNRQWETAAESIGSMTSNGSVTAMRFTAQASKSVTNILVYVQTASASPAYRFGIETSTAGYLPNGTYVGGASNYAVATPSATGWLNVTLPSRATLTAGTVYYVTVRYDNGTIGGSNYIALRRLGTNQNNYRPKENAIDSWLNTVSSGSVQNRDPVFALQYNETGAYEGMPYDNVASNNVYGANWYSEKWIQNESCTIAGVNLPLMKTGTPPDSLYITLRSETDSQDVATITVPQSEIATTLQWYERYFSSPASLVGGKTYRLILRSPSSTSSNYFTVRSLTTSLVGELTYDGTNSYYSTSSNSGSSWIDTFTQDLTYILLLQNAGPMGWIVHPPWDASVDTHASRCADFAWEYRASPSFENEGLLVYGTTAGQITWRRFRAPNYMTAATNVVMGTNIHSWVQLKSNPRTIGNDALVLGAVLEASTFYLGALKWDGTTFTVVGASTFTDNTTVSNCECFEIGLANFGDLVEFTSEMEFTGTSDVGDWPILIWMVGSAWSQGDVTVTFQLFDYDIGAYPTSTDGYISYNSSVTPYVDEIKNQTITTNATRFRDSSGQWKIKATGVKRSSSQFDMDADFVQLQLPGNGPQFLLRNSGAVTADVISLWVINSTVHQRYDVNIYLNSGEDVLFHRDDISISSGNYTIKIVTNRGNIAVFSGS